MIEQLNVELEMQHGNQWLILHILVLLWLHQEIHLMVRLFLKGLSQFCRFFPFFDFCTLETLIFPISQQILVAFNCRFFL